jgi:hypothetical protein
MNDTIQINGLTLQYRENQVEYPGLISEDGEWVDHMHIITNVDREYAALAIEAMGQEANGILWRVVRK